MRPPSTFLKTLNEVLKRYTCANFNLVSSKFLLDTPKRVPEARATHR